MAYIQIPQGQNSIATWPLLGVKALSKSFGRVATVTNLTFSVEEGEIVGLIGPVRSGRSTIVDLLAGTIKPTFGSITIAGEDVTHLGVDSRSRRGVVCCLPPADMLLDLTVLESVAMGGLISQRPFFSRRGGKTFHDESMAALEFTGLADVRNLRADALSACQQRLLAIAVALTAKPSVLIWDDLAAGATKAERSALAALIADIRDNGTSVLLAEQALSPLTEACDRILVLDSGRIIADDVPFRIGRHAAALNADLSCAQ